MIGDIRVSIIAAVAENGVIGGEGDLPWRLSSDLKRFKQITMGKPMVMGRKTFASIGKPLVGRTNIVVSRAAGAGIEGTITAPSLDAALALAAERAARDGVDEIMVCGGGEIYRAAMPAADRMYITHVAVAPEGDVLFPTIDPAVWRVVSRETVAVGESDSAATTFVVYNRIAPHASG